MQKRQRGGGGAGGGPGHRRGHGGDDGVRQCAQYVLPLEIFEIYQQKNNVAAS